MRWSNGATCQNSHQKDIGVSTMIHSIHPFMDFFRSGNYFGRFGSWPWVPFGCFGPKQLHRLGPLQPSLCVADLGPAPQSLGGW